MNETVGLSVNNTQCADASESIHLKSILNDCKSVQGRTPVIQAVFDEKITELEKDKKELQ